MFNNIDDFGLQRRLLLTFLKRNEVSFDDWPEPDLVCAFQPGFWGYETWKASICPLRAPLLVTSYNEEEADEELHTLRSDFHCDEARKKDEKR